MTEYVINCLFLIAPSKYAISAYFHYIDIDMTSFGSWKSFGPTVIKNFMPRPAEHEIYPAHTGCLKKTWTFFENAITPLSMEETFPNFLWL